MKNESSLYTSAATRQFEADSEQEKRDLIKRIFKTFENDPVFKKFYWEECLSSLKDEDTGWLDTRLGGKWEMDGQGWLHDNEGGLMAHVTGLGTGKYLAEAKERAVYRFAKQQPDQLTEIDPEYQRKLYSPFEGGPDLQAQHKEQRERQNARREYALGRLSRILEREDYEGYHKLTDTLALERLKTSQNLYFIKHFENGIDNEGQLLDRYGEPTPFHPGSVDRLLTAQLRQDVVRTYVQQHPELRKTYSDLCTQALEHDIRSLTFDDVDLERHAKLQEREDHANIYDAFRKRGLPLCDELRWRLMEAPGFEWDDKGGSGFTRASRFLAKFITQPRGPNDRELFRQDVVERLRDGEAIDWQETFRKILDEIPEEEGRMIIRLIQDLICPIDSSTTIESLQHSKKKLDVGYCTSAETYFLDYVGAFEYKQFGGGKINYLVDKSGKALLLEKMGMGQSYSCLSLEPLLFNGVRIPPGALFAVSYPANTSDQTKQTTDGSVLPITDCQFELKRLTTLAVSPEHRKRAFGKHLDFQKQNGMEGCDTVDIKDYRAKAARLLASVR